MSAARRRPAARRPAPSRQSAAQARQAAADRTALAARRRQRRLIWLAGLAVVLLVAGIGVGYQVRETYRDPVPPAAVATAGPAAPIVDGQPVVWGRADAPVTVDMWADFHCPHCRDFEDAYGAQLRQAVAEGTVRLRTHPLAFVDAGSTAAANAYACAAAAGYAEPYFTALYANADLRWSEHQVRTLFTQVAGAEDADVTACLSQRRHAGWVASLDGAAERAGVTATPALAVQGEQIDITALTRETLTTTIEEAARR